jgi:two-component system, sensor histidine kinase and response regulator
MTAFVLLILAVLFQLAAVVLAIRLIRVTGFNWAWIAISLAVLVMLVRRGMSSYQMWSGGVPGASDWTYEGAGLVASLLMLLGVASIGPLLRGMQRTHQTLEETVIDITKQRKADEHVKRLNAVLRAIRNANQVIARERDRDRLLSGICGSLVETRGYHYAWIVLWDAEQQVIADAEAGIGEPALAALRERLARGESVACLSAALTADGVIVMDGRRTLCGSCPLAEMEHGYTPMAVRLARGDEVYGVMVAAIPADYAAEPEELAMLEEVAGDISYALYGMRKERQRQEAERALRLEQSRLACLVRLSQMTDAPLQQITNFTLEEAVRLTESGIGYLAFTNQNESVLTMHAWSRTAMTECAIIDKPIHYPVVTTGLWGEAVRQRQAVITNDYAAPNPLKKGHPEGHVEVRRHMNTPIFDGDRIVAVIGVGNKEQPYDDSDVRQLTLLGQGMWQLIQRREAQEQLRQAHDDLEVRVRVRTAELADANEELQQERYLLHTLMDNLPHNIYFKDTSSRFVRVNQALARLFGLADPAEAVGKTDADFFGLEHAAQALADEREILRTGRPIIDKEEKETWPDGRETWTLTTKMPYYDPEGRLAGTFGISRDNTQQQRAEAALRASELRYRTLYDSSRDAIMVLDPNRGFLSGNPAAIRLFGCRDEAHFKTFTPADLSPERQPDGAPSTVQAAAMIGIALEEGVHYFEWRHRRIDGVEFPATVLLTRMELEGRRLLQATVRDVTEEQRAAAALRAARDAAEAASRAKSTFLANMSHEIRTPLNAVIGMTELVLNSQLSAQQREYLSTVKDAGEALLSVINDILDFSKIEAGKLVPDRAPFDVRENLGDTMKSLALRAHQKDLELAFRCCPQVPRRVIGDYNRLRQIVINLVGNAVKFTQRGEVVLEVDRESLDGEIAVLHFAVSDTGAGIPADKQQVIFGMFEQGDGALTRRHGGTGLGLAIASRLVALMGGSMWVESEVGRGSRFHFTVRFELADANEVDDVVIVPACLHALRVLVVDDTATNRRILEELLRHWQMEPALADSAPAALDTLRAAHRAGSPFQLILTDAHMPDVDGLMLTESIRTDAALAATPVIMLTSGDRPEDASECERLGISAYLLKPVKQSELLAAIERTLGVPVPARELLAHADANPAIRPLRILLAEDSVVNQKLAVALLERLGHSVTIAQNGREAVRAVERDSFDLILMDIQMPEMDGLEATAAIRARQADSLHRTPIVAMTAHALKGDRDRCLEAGMDGYLAKPIRPRELHQALADMFPTD